MDEEDTIVGRGLSRFSKYTREQRERVARVTASLTGESYKARDKIKFGIRIIVTRDLTPEEFEEHKRAKNARHLTYEDVREYMRHAVAAFDILEAHPVPKRVTGIHDRFYGSRTRRENAYRALLKRPNSGKGWLALRIARPENGTRKDVTVEIYPIGRHTP